MKIPHTTTDKDADVAWRCVNFGGFGVLSGYRRMAEIKRLKDGLPVVAQSMHAKLSSGPQQHVSPEAIALRLV
jgi:hypothetical protein